MKQPKSLVQLKSVGGGLLGSLCEIAVGILLLVNPTLFTSTIIIVVGFGLILMGLLSMVHYFRTPAAEAEKEQNLVKGLMLAGVGIFCAVKSEWFLSTFPVLTRLYGVAILAIGLSKVQWTVDGLRMKRAGWYWAGLSALVTLICAAVILSNPFGSGQALWIFTGVSLMAEAALDMLAILWKGKSPAGAPAPAQSAEKNSGKPST
ncbi:MAG: HdeD family acid-resistance protein [Aristaeellaceae bacterium]